MSETREKAWALLASVPAGPWKVHQGTRGHGVRAVDSKIAIAVCGRADAHQAVATFIAATPDLLVALCDEVDEAGKEITRLRTVQDKFVTDLAKCDGIIAGQDELYRLEVTRASGTIRHLQAHNDHLVESNAALKSQVAEAVLCRELIAERDALKAKLSDIEAETRRRAESADPNDETWHTRAEYLLRINAEAEVARLRTELASLHASAKSHAASTKYVADLLAKVLRGDYVWSSGVSWAVGEAHRLLTGGAPDGAYVRAQDDKGRRIDGQSVPTGKEET
jgi:hypothetical protein